MRRVRYNVAATLDGYIAGPAGEFDWIPNDPTVDFQAIFAKIDTVLVGRRSYEAMRAMGGGPLSPDMRVYVFSTTMRPEDVGDATLVRDDAAGAVRALRRERGDGEIWLFGGGSLFASLVAAGQVDRIEVTVVPVLLGAGTPLFPPGLARGQLRLTDTRVYPSGMVTLAYDVLEAEGDGLPRSGGQGGHAGRVR